MSIVLHDTASILPMTLAIHLRDSDQDWDILGIEIYADPECTVLLADDISIGELPPSSQLSIYAALNAFDHQRDSGFRARGPCGRNHTIWMAT